MARIDCPHCHIPFRVPPMAKDTVACPACRKAVDLPDDALPDAILVDEDGKDVSKKRYLYDDEEDEFERKRPPKRRRRKPRKVITQSDTDPAEAIATGASTVLRIIFGIILMVAGSIFLISALISIMFGSNYCLVTGFVVGPGLGYLGYRIIINE